MIVWDHWHIEPSSICTLKCPRCPRAEVPESLLNRQLTLNFFKNQIGADTVKQIKKITFCGNDGDPIYCKDFLDICSWIKQISPNIQLVLITNGSYKTQDWWKQLGQTFNSYDEIHWSIDGWDQESNEQYRINSDWSSIMNGIDAFTQANNITYKIWASIAFKFNEQHLLRQKVSATACGFDGYQLTKSTKFASKYSAYGIDDPLEPTNTQLIASGNRFERSMEPLTTKQRPGAEFKTLFLQRAQDLQKTAHAGICFIGNKGVFLNSQGEFYPCCWTANRYEHNQAWHTRAQAQFNLNTRTFQEIITDNFWSTDFLEFDSLECQTKCTHDRLTDQHHTTEW
jgi:MoaA/NifB/PqqE/SkfB family radical SAM enzyme